MKKMYFDGKNNISFLAGVVSENILYYSSYNFGGIWKLDMETGESEMLTFVPDNRKHEFAFKINDEIWFAPAYQEKNIFDVYNIKSRTINQILAKQTKNIDRSYSNFIETTNEVWVMPAMVNYIMIIDKKNKNIEYVNVFDLGLEYGEFYFINAIKVENKIYMYENKKSNLICIDIKTKEINISNLGRIETEFRNIFKSGENIYVIPKNINGNSIIKYDTLRSEIVNEYRIVDNPCAGELICSGCKVVGNIAYISPYNFNKIIKWNIEKESELISIESECNSDIQQLCYWEAVDTNEGFIFGIEKKGAPIFILENKDETRILNGNVDELRNGLLKVL